MKAITSEMDERVMGKKTGIRNGEKLETKKARTLQALADHSNS